MKRTCERFESAVERSLGGVEDEGDRHVLAAHRPSCDACATFEAIARRLDELTRARLAPLSARDRPARRKASAWETRRHFGVRAFVFALASLTGFLFVRSVFESGFTPFTMLMIAQLVAVAAAVAVRRRFARSSSTLHRGVDFGITAIVTVLALFYFVAAHYGWTMMPIGYVTLAVALAVIVLTILRRRDDPSSRTDLLDSRQRSLDGTLFGIRLALPLVAFVALWGYTAIWNVGSSLTAGYTHLFAWPGWHQFLADARTRPDFRRAILVAAVVGIYAWCVVKVLPRVKRELEDLR